MAKVQAARAPDLGTLFEEGSVWEDEVWRFPVTTPGANRTLFSMNWAIPLADGKVLTDPDYAEVLHAWKQVLWIMLTAPPDGHPRKGSFCGRFGTALRLLVPWMISSHSLDFVDLDRRAFGEFQEVVRGKYQDDEDVEIDELLSEDGVTVDTVSSYFAIFSLPYFVRNELAAAGISHPLENPLNGRSALDVARDFCKTETSPTREVPDSIFVAAVNTTMATLDEPWLEPLIELNQVLSSQPVGDHERECESFRQAYFPDTPLTTTSVRCTKEVVLRVRAACQLLIQATSALRISELCGIKSRGRNKSTGLPACISVERTFDDEYEIFSLNAELFKHTPSSEPATWVLGMRPTGSNYLPPPVRAIDVLERLDSGWRQFAGKDTLLIQFTVNWGFPTSRRFVAGATGDVVRRHQQRWLIESGCAKESDAISTHMWRKTFARYLVRVSADLLPAISHHLQHLSIAMTEIGYCKPDKTMRDIVADARVEEAGSIIFGAITGQRRIEGPVAQEIRELANGLSQRLGNRPAASVSQDIEQEIRERRIELYGSEIGWCVFRGESARCHLLADDPTPAFLRLAPAFGNRRPAVCHKCANFGIGDEHVGFWHERHSSFQKRLAACGPETPPSIKTCLKRSLDRCDTVLSWMSAKTDG